MKKLFVILTRIGAGWEATGTVTDRNGATRTETFRRRSIARRELKAHQVAMDAAEIEYDRSDYRIGTIDARPSKKVRRYRNRLKGNAHA